MQQKDAPRAISEETGPLSMRQSEPRHSMPQQKGVSPQREEDVAMDHNDWNFPMDSGLSGRPKRSRRSHALDAIQQWLSFGTLVIGKRLGDDVRAFE